MKVKFVIIIVFLLTILIGYFFIKLIAPKITEQDKINSEIYFNSSNYNFKATIIEHHQLNAYTAGVLKLKLINGKINTYKDYGDNITTGTFNSQDSIMYAFATFYPEIIRKVDHGIKPIMIEMNSKLREVKIFTNKEDFFISKIWYYGDNSFKKRAYLNFIKENNIKNDLFW